MPKYRFKADITREALQWTGYNKNEMAFFLKTPFLETDSLVPAHLILKHRSGELRGKPGDWVIIDQLGEPYICPREVFEMTYEPA
jgi:hypothetical protein